MPNILTLVLLATACWGAWSADRRAARLERSIERQGDMLIALLQYHRINPVTLD